MRMTAKQQREQVNRWRSNLADLRQSRRVQGARHFGPMPGKPLVRQRMQKSFLLSARHGLKSSGFIQLGCKRVFVSHFNRVRPAFRKCAQKTVKVCDKIAPMLVVARPESRELKHRDANLVSNFFTRFPFSKCPILPTIEFFSSGWDLAFNRAVNALVRIGWTAWGRTGQARDQSRSNRTINIYISSRRRGTPLTL